MLSQFDYVKPLVLDEALDALSHHDDTYILAGGTDLLIMLRHHLIDAKHIVDIKGVSELSVFNFVEGEGLEIGANVVVNTLPNSAMPSAAPPRRRPNRRRAEKPSPQPGCG